ncbi:DNA methyltransferase ZMET4 [Coprinopsis cinerea okayama7|uniref:tRNA (cytosine(38)-C(5))-methyltransferase n=1 Tax=Coprinopsis cinerea (strain Okayama-7 / 130 / ATCC MYA-4618 / FGSC 9003) TaxID=240176 RepID=A8N0W4_COPC7|nr:DNA methyltransferase ZMET4 [Coprinopsis cinerea okayama7\|eukprot:XP_001828513.2 DNA methyltransferase ZMET4 [Coprinopsis cinerea okayama7\
MRALEFYSGIDSLAKEYGQVDIWLLSPACQPYTVLNPNAQGAEDPRAQSYLHLLRNVLPGLEERGCLPGYVLVENVAGFEGSTTRQLQLEVLKELGYHIQELLLTPLQFGIPNSRLRYYMLARRGKDFSRPGLGSSSGDGPRGEEEGVSVLDQGDEEEYRVLRHIPGQPAEWREEDVEELRGYLDEETSLEESNEFAVSDKVLSKWGRLFDIVLPSGRRSCCFTRGYTHLVERSGSILQMAEDLDTTQTFDKFLQETREGNADAVKILYPLRLRYFSPSELLRIFAFEGKGGDGQGFVWPTGVSTKSKYKLIGNSVNVRVVEELIRYLLS